MKAVLLSIKPKYCELIASGKKTVEIRKNRPKIDVPFNVYIYQTKQNWIYKILKWLKLYQGKVIGEFVCDAIIIDRTFGHDEMLNTIACLDIAEISAYCTNDPMYAWHISDLKIYDEPKDLDEFEKPCSRDCKNCKYWYSGSPIDYEPPCCEWEEYVIERPPQNWCYVENLEV